MLFKLRKPVRANGKEVSEVTLKEEFTGADMIRIQNQKSKGGDGDLIAAVVTAATGWDLGIVSHLDARDLVAINNAVQPFFLDGNG
jgi:hypothetical protein